MPNKSQVKGRAKQVRGKAEEAKGVIKGDAPAKARGRARQKEGKVEAIAGDLKEKARHAIDKLRTKHVTIEIGDRRSHS